MVAETSWRELCRFEDPMLARAVATSIASMEFDVRLRPSGGPAVVVQVVSGEWGELADVLDEIVDEQVEFDRMLLDRSSATPPPRIIIVIAVTGAAELLLLLALVDW